MSSVIDHLNEINRAGQRSGAAYELSLIMDEFARLHLNRELMPREKWTLFAKYLNERSVTYECSELQSTHLAGHHPGPADLSPNRTLGLRKPSARARYNRRRRA